MKSKIFIITATALLLLSGCARSVDEFTIEHKEKDKYTGLAEISSEGNWTKCTQGFNIAFNVTAAYKEGVDTADTYLVLHSEDGWNGGHFLFGDRLLLTIDGEEIGLDMQGYTRGKTTSLSPGTFEEAIFLEKETLAKIANARTIEYAVNANRFKHQEYKEATGHFSAENIANIRLIAQEVGAI